MPVSGTEAASSPASSKELSLQNAAPWSGISPGCAGMMPPDGRDSLGWALKKSKDKKPLILV